MQKGKINPGLNEELSGSVSSLRGRSFQSDSDYLEPPQLRGTRKHVQQGRSLFKVSLPFHPLISLPILLMSHKNARNHSKNGIPLGRQWR